MSTTRLLPAPDYDPNKRIDDAGVELLREELAEARRQIHKLKGELKAAQEDARQFSRAVLGLRSILNPLYKGLRQIYGEIEAFAVEQDSPFIQPNNFWETQKRRFPGKPSELIDLLLERPMNTTQLATAGRMDPRTVTKTIYILNKAGLVEKNGGMFSLKQI